MMPTNKAIKLLKDYKANNFNAKKTLMDNGYTEQSATKASRTILNRADKAVKATLPIDTNSLQETATDVFTLLGYDRNDVVKMLKDVVEQNRDFTNKLKAMKPLLDALNYRLDDNEQGTMPQVNIKLDNVSIESPNIREGGVDLITE